MLAEARAVTSVRKRNATRISRRILKHWEYYLLVLIPMAYFVIFKYVPMVGAQIAFRDFNVIQGMWGSPWVGLREFARFFESPSFWRLIRNTIFLSGYELLVGFPIPIILALMMNMVTGARFKRTVQMVTYAPHFISTVVIVGMLGVFLSKNFGLANHFIDALGGQRLFFLGREQWFRSGQ